MIDDPYRNLPAPRQRRGIAASVLLGLVAFAAGLILAAVVVHRSDRITALLHPGATPAPVGALATSEAPGRPAPAPQPQVVAAADPALTARVDAIGERVEAIDARAQEVTGDATRAQALLVAFASRRAIDRGQPLGYLEGMLRRLFGATQPQAAAMVIGGAQRPVTLLKLQDDFAVLAPTLVAAGPSEGWWSAFRREAGGLFVVRRAETLATDPEAERARIGRALAQGDVDAALAEVARLPGAARAGAWIAAARRYVLVHNALDRIEAAALLARPEPAAPADPGL